MRLFLVDLEMTQGHLKDGETNQVEGVMGTLNGTLQYFLLEPGHTHWFLIFLPVPPVSQIGPLLY